MNKTKILPISLNIVRDNFDEATSTDLVLMTRHETPGRQGTVLTNKLTFTKGDHNRWKTSIDLSDLSESDLQKQADKLGDWLIRIGEVLKNNKINTINLDEL